MPKVHIVGNDYETLKMFLRRNWKAVDHWEESDLIQFTGGADVEPSYYGEIKHASTYTNPKRDAYETNLFFLARKENKKMAGICRGGQLLNIMCGGRMWQHVDGHHGYLKATFEGKTYEVSCDHHQMMIPGVGATIIGVASPTRTTFRETALEKDISKGFQDVECLFYSPDVLCFQPHPEWVSKDHESQELYFQLLESKIGLKV